jgi:acetylornithine deacetylase/succinyl-diaminopimelate desuccinylase-like protein
MRPSRVVAQFAVLLAAIVITAPRGHAQTGAKTKWDSVARDVFKELIEINTENSDGSTLQAAQAMAARLKAAGFPDSDVTVLSNAPRKGNLVARIHGRASGKKPILLLSHIDVVEAKPADWTLPPFTLIEKDGIFYGRGTSDNKDDAAIGLTILMRLKAEGYAGDRDVIVAATTDEEGGGANGAGWLMQNHRDLIDAEYAFNEGGGGRLRDTVKVSHDVQASEKKVQTFSLETFNSGGHSSVPRDDNAITELSAALVKLTPTVFPVHLNDITRAYFSKLAPTLKDEAPDLATAMKAIVANPNDAKATAALAKDPRYNSQLRTTCVATMLTGGHASNALPQRAQATVNCRVLPDETPEYVKGVLEKLVSDTGVHVVARGSARNSPPSPLTPDLMGQIERITKEMWPGVPVIPTMSTGATDGVSLRNGGIPTYGISGQFYGESNAHGMNERIPVKAFYESLEFMYRLVRSVTGEKKPIS